MRYLIDTDIAIGASSGRNAKAAKKVLNSRGGEIGLSMIVLHELYFGAYRSSRVQMNEAAVGNFALSFTLLPYEANDARHAGDIRAHLRGVGSTIGPLDTLIAGQARARGLILVSGNMREFARVPGLDVVDWTL